MKKNRILALALAVCFVAIMAFGTLAYFTDSDSVQNTFMTATSDDPDQKLFDVDLYETDVDEDGNVKANTYENILPGQTMVKDPTVENTGLYAQYVRMNVTVSDAAAWTAACEKHGLANPAVMFGKLNSSWELKETVPNTEDDTITYVYYLKDVLEPEATSTLFEEVTIPAEFTIEDMNTLKEFTLTIVADAIQSDNNGSSAVEAFENWE